MHSGTARPTHPTTTTRLTLRRADGSDLAGVLALLAETAGWLNRRGVRQWPAGGFPAERISPLIEEGTMYVLDGEGAEGGEEGEAGPAATLALDGHADPEFWTAGDVPEAALYVHKLSVSRAYAGLGLGQALLDWAGLRVLATGRRWLRLDCSKDNPGLQRYYRGQRFTHLRTVDLPHRASGALFQRAGGLRGDALAGALPFADLRGPLTGPLTVPAEPVVAGAEDGGSPSIVRSRR
ncbi:GNAT family N-acetyltransferase [Streptosporangium sp. NPDC004379]|uniref:GNAT family N-acetyltransferase n=1 Tax=Streptosporangium sp. NPDC004379 TaxID=3366189 RepID=UPI0036A68EA3